MTCFDEVFPSGGACQWYLLSGPLLAGATRLTEPYMWLGRKAGTSSLWSLNEWWGSKKIKNKNNCRARMSMYPMASAYTVAARRAKGRTGVSGAGLTCFHTTTCSAQWRCGRTACTDTPQCRHSTLWVSGLWTRWWRCCHPSAKTTPRLCGPPGYVHTAHNKQ